MNKLTLLTLVATFAAGAAQAQGPLEDNHAVQAAVSTKSRAEVRAELDQARRDGSIRVSSIAYNPALDSSTLKTRDEVRAELMAARRSGQAHDLVGEDSGSIALSRNLRQHREAAPILAGKSALGE
jgi:Domain of unknown function (DUF4148)